MKEFVSTDISLNAHGTEVKEYYDIGDCGIAVLKTTWPIHRMPIKVATDGKNMIDIQSETEIVIKTRSKKIIIKYDVERDAKPVL
jgi:hypothetical protein